MLRAKWGATVWVTVALQWAVVLLVAAATLAGFGATSAGSALAGGAAIALPNTLFAIGLMLRVAVKFSLRQPVWPALLAGVVLAVKAQWLALWVTRKMR